MPDQKRRKGDHPGTLIIIGGHEDKEHDMVILKEVARRVGKGRLVVTTVASHQPEGYFESYQEAFKKLGITDLTELYIAERSEAMQEEKIKAFDDVKAVFFTGGDQLRITSQIGDTPIYSRIHEIYDAGGLIVGTSAGASVMCETMMIEGKGGESHRIGDLRMAPGLKLIRNAIIDQHFAERGRMGRLLGAVAQNPRVLGIGIDEDTAIIMEGQEYFTVLGDGAVYVVDGSGVTHSNIADGANNQILSIYDIKLHVLSEGDAFDLVHRRPIEVWKLKDQQSPTQHDVPEQKPVRKKTEQKAAEKT
ncbi:cyanophycinase [Deinococcus cellulosilyticus]|uniref:Cyanophycinase n=1 Tax=Deinococcus cellulosilyticus (strain DSM 18568 / NBRC 106333 / KACC 11606 / 5516J-15) TaxID=1223518 RepID=A0A511N4S6_DEIC1|nr:cyanophycinase [Deinococcus cellulosilyticus]GEM47864.1 cyanophycinase [Deinococcus cellulosilyticus NBRC 106333 = KACC 11606]